MKTIKTIMAALVALLIFAPAVYAANADNPDGCKPVGLFGQHSEPFQAYETAAAQTIVEGDPVKLDGSGQIVIGTAIDSALLGFARSGVTASSAGDLIYVYSNPSTVFQCQSSGSFAITMISDLVDLEGSTGIFEVNENASVYKPLRIVGYNPNDSVGANARLYVRLNMASLGAGASGVFEDLSVLDDLTVADDTAIGGLLGVTGDFAVNTTKFTVTAASGNTLVAGTLDITGNCDADAGLDVSGGSLTIDAQAITQTTGGQVTLAGNVDADAGLDVAGAAQTFTGTLGSWTMALADSALTQTHTGQVTFTGNADATLGLDISGAALTVANQAITQTTGGQVTLAGNLDANLGIDVAGAAQTFTGTLGSWTMALADSALTQTHTGQVTFTGNLDANLGIDVAGGDLTIAEGADKAIFTAPALTADRTITIPDANVALADVAHDNRVFLDLLTGYQAVDMAGAAHALVMGAAGAAQTQVAANLFSVDANTVNPSEDLTLPPAADFIGLVWVYIDGAENVVIDPLPLGYGIEATPGQILLYASNGTVWRPMGYLTDFLAHNKLAMLTSAASGVPGTLALYEATDNGNDKIAFEVPAALTADRMITIPDANVDLGDVAHTNRTELDAITAAQVTFAGNLDSNAGVDITGGALTIANQAITQTTGGQVDFAGNVDASLGLDVSGAVLSTSGGFTQSAGTFGVVNSAGNATIDNSNATGATYVILGTDTNATTFEVQNDSAADYLKIDGDGDQLYTCAAASADAYRVEAVGGNDYLLIDSLVPSVAIGNATTNPAVSVLGFGQITLGGNVDASAGVDITGDLTLSGHKDSQTMIFGSFDYPEDDGTEWWGVGGAAQLPATITAKNCYINLSGLKVGDEIVSYTLYGTTIENTALTLDATLVEVNSAGTESDPLGDGTNAIAQVDATGDFGVTATFTAAYTVAAGRMYRIKLLGTTGATDTITVQAATGLLNRK